MLKVVMLAVCHEQQPSQHTRHRVKREPREQTCERRQKRNLSNPSTTHQPVSKTLVIQRSSQLDCEVLVLPSFFFFFFFSNKCNVETWPKRFFEFFFLVGNQHETLHFVDVEIF